MAGATGPSRKRAAQPLQPLSWPRRTGALPPAAALPIHPAASAEPRPETCDRPVGSWSRRRRRVQQRQSELQAPDSCQTRFERRALQSSTAVPSARPAATTGSGSPNSAGRFDGRVQLFGPRCWPPRGAASIRCRLEIDWLSGSAWAGEIPPGLWSSAVASTPSAMTHSRHEGSRRSGKTPACCGPMSGCRATIRLLEALRQRLNIEGGLIPRGLPFSSRSSCAACWEQTESPPVARPAGPRSGISSMLAFVGVNGVGRHHPGQAGQPGGAQPVLQLSDRRRRHFPRAAVPAGHGLVESAAACR